MPSFCTSTGILPQAAAASTCRYRPFWWTSSLTSLMGWMVPISLLAYITEVRMVSMESALSSAARSMRPVLSTGTSESSKPPFFKSFSGLSTEMCSMLLASSFLPLAAFLPASPRMARLLASVAPPVKVMVSGPSAPISSATFIRASSSAVLAARPRECRAEGFPKSGVRNFSANSFTLSSTG